jgi:cytochrome b subunit of formate dehydrogenase
MQPPHEVVHWMFATGFLFLGLCLLAEAIVGREVWRRRPWRAYLWPSTAFLMGLLMWPVMVFFTSSAVHMLAHGAWAQVMMAAGAAQLALVRGRARSPSWDLTVPFAFVVSGLAFLLHEQNPWLFSRSAFLHHAIGWMLIVAALFPLGAAIRPRSTAFRTGFALTFVTLAVMLYCDRNVAPIFGHLSPRAAAPDG